LDGDGEVLVIFGILRFEIAPDRCGLGLGGLNRHAGFETRLDAERTIAAVLKGIHRGSVEALIHHRGDVDGGVEVAVDAGEGFGSDADDGEVDAANADEFTDYVGIAGKLGLPEVVADDGYGVAAGDFAFGREEGAADDGLNAEGGKEIVAGDDARINLWQGIGTGGDTHGGELESGDVCEGLGLGAEIAEIGVGVAGEGIVRGGVVDVHDIAGGEDGERAEEYGIGEAEDGAVGADAEGQREDGDGGETGIF